MSEEGAGISDVEINKIIENSSNDGLRNNFAGVFPSDDINTFKFLQLNEKNKSKNFLTFNTDILDKPETHLGSI